MNIDNWGLIKEIKGYGINMELLKLIMIIIIILILYLRRRIFLFMGISDKILIFKNSNKYEHSYLSIIIKY